MLKNAPLGIVGLILLAGSLLLLWFIILSGVTSNTPLDKTYFLRADTDGISGARPITQWTYFYFCGDGNQDCGGAHAAPAFGKAWDSRPSEAPSSLVGGYGGHTTSYHYYYLWRFGWVFFIITLFFETLAFFSGFLACCGRLGAAVSSLIAFAALFFHTIATVLMTVTFVQARNAFQNAGRSASLGRYAFGFAWGSWAALLIATVLFCLGTRKDKDHVSSSSGRKFGFGRRRSTRSYDGRRVKDDYS